MRSLRLVVALALLATGLPAAETLTSPDGRLVVTCQVVAGRPQWQLDCDGQPLLLPAALGLELVREPFREPLALERVERGGGDTVWRPVWGPRSAVRDRYQELTLTLREAREGGRRYQIVVRAYDEGVGLRYRVPAQPGLARVGIGKRLTAYRFADNRPVYQNRNYEYGTGGIDKMSRSEGAVTVDAGGGRFVGLTDADRAGFSEGAWERDKVNPHTIIGTLRSSAEGDLPFHTSWEALIVGRAPAQLYEHRHLVENLNPPCALADTSWIRAGTAICQVRNTRLVTDELRKLVAFASRHNIPQVEIDHSWCGAETKWTPAEIEFFAKSKSTFWDDKPEWRQNVGGNPMAPAKGWVPFRPKADSGGNFVDLDPPALAAYGASLTPPVGISVYLRGAVLRECGGEHPARDVFAVYERWGLAGVKLGFVPTGSQANERAVADLVRLAAEHRLMVNIHDSYFPNGLTRTYPNLVNIEGVAGEEAEHAIPGATKGLHDVMLPFTRCLMGPVDYTPEMYKPNKTHAHQVAMLVVYLGRPSIRGGMRQWLPGGVGGSEIEFVSRVPALFDDYRVWTELGQDVTVARRRGETWFVASMSAAHPRERRLTLDFLPPGKTFRATVWSDTPGKQQTTRGELTVTAATTVPISMAANGGHLMLIEP